MHITPLVNINVIAYMHLSINTVHIEFQVFVTSVKIIKKE